MLEIDSDVWGIGATPPLGASTRCLICSLVLDASFAPSRGKAVHSVDQIKTEAPINPIQPMGLDEINSF